MRKSKLREFQDGMQNAGWRIKIIPHDDPSKPMKTPSNPFALIGMAILVAGIWLMFRTKNGNYAALIIVGFVFTMFSMLFAFLIRRRSWVRVQAVCLDKETGCIGNREWEFRLRCRFELAGKTYTVTPTFLQAYNSEEEIQSFLAEFISPDGTCVLSVNPRNPLQTEIVSERTAAVLGQKQIAKGDV